MTPEQQQPKEHCGHECVCGVLMVGGIEGDKSPCDFTGCKHDTRSRPHPAPQAPECSLEKCLVMQAHLKMRTELRSALTDVGIYGNPMVTDEWILDYVLDFIKDKKKHDAAIGRKAREDVLKDLEEFTWLRYKEKRICERGMDEHCEIRSEIKRLQSLRQPSEHPTEPAPTPEDVDAAFRAGKYSMKDEIRKARDEYAEDLLKEFANTSAPPVNVSYVRHIIESLRTKSEQQEQPR